MVDAGRCAMAMVITCDHSNPESLQNPNPTCAHMRRLETTKKIKTPVQKPWHHTEKSWGIRGVHHHVGEKNMETVAKLHFNISTLLGTSTRDLPRISAGYHWNFVSDNGQLWALNRWVSWRQTGSDRSQMITSSESPLCQLFIVGSIFYSPIFSTEFSEHL